MARPIEVTAQNVEDILARARDAKARGINRSGRAPGTVFEDGSVAGGSPIPGSPATQGVRASGGRGRPIQW